MLKAEGGMVPKPPSITSSSESGVSVRRASRTPSRRSERPEDAECCIAREGPHGHVSKKQGLDQKGGARQSMAIPQLQIEASDADWRTRISTEPNKTLIRRFYEEVGAREMWTWETRSLPLTMFGPLNTMETA
jgi:hypothetical protein